MTTLLVDADIVLYRAACSVEREIEYEPDMWVLATDVTEAISAFEDSISYLLKQAETDAYALCFSDKQNFRKELYPEYKANRTARKPMAFSVIRERVIEANKPRVVMKPTLEADDCLGILATAKNNMVIWSADKDLRQIPGKHLTDTGIKEISEEEADWWFYTQILIGDTADNYKGCPGIGPKKADSILTKANGKLWEAIVNAYTSAGLSEEDALTQARLARILRACDWDSDKQEVKPWTPTTA